MGYVTISSDPATNVPYLFGRSYGKDGIEAAEWHSKGACIIEREGELAFFYYWEGSHRNENPVFVGSGEIRFPRMAARIETGNHFFTAMARRDSKECDQETEGPARDDSRRGGDGGR